MDLTIQTADDVCQKDDRVALQRLYEMSDEQFNQLSAKEIELYLEAAHINHKEMCETAIAMIRRKRGWRSYLIHLTRRWLRSIRQS